MAVIASKYEGRSSARGSAVAEAGFAPAFREGENAEWERIQRGLRGAGLQAPRVAELRADPEPVHILVRGASWCGSTCPNRLKNFWPAWATCRSGSRWPPSGDAMGLTRKYAVPLLEWLDGSGTIVWHGDERSLTGRAAPPR